MKFEWDEAKAQKNVEKHNVSFEYASLVFEDEYRLEEYDYDHSKDEDRYNIIGMVKEVLFVVCTYRDHDTIRIISARKANKAERRKYEWQWLR